MQTNPSSPTTKKTNPKGLVFFVVMGIWRADSKGGSWRQSGGERADCRQWRAEGGERVAAVDKIEEKRKPEDFIGHRNRALATNPAFPQKSESVLPHKKKHRLCRCFFNKIRPLRNE